MNILMLLSNKYYSCDINIQRFQLSFLNYETLHVGGGGGGGGGALNF